MLEISIQLFMMLATYHYGIMEVWDVNTSNQEWWVNPVKLIVCLPAEPTRGSAIREFFCADRQLMGFKDLIHHSWQVLS